jgi:uncharacterized membrane-anchored protein YhcB (DUF1043 family)
MKINNEKRKEIYDSYCKAEAMLQNLKSIVQNEMELTDDDICDHFSKSCDLSDLIMDLYNEVNKIYD